MRRLLIGKKERREGREKERGREGGRKEERERKKERKILLYMCVYGVYIQCWIHKY